VKTLNWEALKPAAKKDQIGAYYRTLYAAWGCQHWWPARSRFEVIVGAYLTQNTSWNNVEIAMRRLRGAERLNLEGIRSLPVEELENLIRPAGYFRQKATRLKTFVAFVDREYNGSLRRMFAQPTEKLREELLALNGVGRETADSILLYAGQHPVFVVDAYTRRILERHENLSADAGYEEIRALCERELSGPQNIRGALARTAPSATMASPGGGAYMMHASAHAPSPMSRAKRSDLAQIYNDMHGLIVTVGKRYCLKREARCDQCPLKKFLPKGDGTKG